HKEGRLYITDWQQTVTHVVDLQTRQEIAPLSLGTDVSRINAVRPGRLAFEKMNENRAYLVDSATGAVRGEFPYPVQPGDGETDPTGLYYYHCTGSSSSAFVRKYTVATDIPAVSKTGPVHAGGTRNLVMAGDGSVLFWRAFRYDADLNEL